MARKTYPFEDAERDYRASSALSVNALAVKHGIPEATLRREAKKRGWIRGASETKRQMVKDGLAGVSLTKVLTNDEVRQINLDEASQDITDMREGLAVARACISKLASMVDGTDNPRDVKVIVEANKAAIETIRRIRGLDDNMANATPYEEQLRELAK